MRGGDDEAAARQMLAHDTNEQVLPAGTRRPAIRRNSEVLPEPFGPTTARTSPEEASKSRPENTSRPPLIQSMWCPESRILPFHSPLKLMGTASEFVGTALLQHAC